MFDHLKQVAFIGDDYVKGEIHGVILIFHGLNMEHCAFNDFAIYRKYMDFVLRFIPA
jgi:hypothetical protein